MRKRRREGIVLLEAIAALLVVGLTAGAALELFGAHLRAARQASALVTAVALAQDRLAALRLADVAGTGRLPDSLARGATVPPLGAFRWRADAQPARDAALVGLVVTVAWDGGSYTLTTYVREPLAPGRAP